MSSTGNPPVPDGFLAANRRGFMFRTQPM